jgi:hypothetical protein
VIIPDDGVYAGGERFESRWRLFVHSSHLLQEVMKGVQLVYDFATFRRPSQMVGQPAGTAPIARPEDVELQVPLNPNAQQQQQPSLQVDGHEPPGTPALSTFEVDDEFNLPISVAIVILLIYIFVGAIIYWTWEDWGFFESFYFVFISMSTIGFGDFVPQVCKPRHSERKSVTTSLRKSVGLYILSLMVVKNKTCVFVLRPYTSLCRNMQYRAVK